MLLIIHSWLLAGLHRRVETHKNHAQSPITFEVPTERYRTRGLDSRIYGFWLSLAKTDSERTNSDFIDNRPQHTEVGPQTF
jgi:hypothetical protein